MNLIEFDGGCGACAGWARVVGGAGQGLSRLLGFGLVSWWRLAELVEALGDSGGPAGPAGATAVEGDAGGL